MKYYDYNKSKNEDYTERLELVMERLAEIAKAPEIRAPYDTYFKTVSAYALTLYEAGKAVLADASALNGAAGRDFLQKVHTDVLKGDAYQTSYFNPTYATEQLGEELGAALSFVYAQLRNEITEVAAGSIVGLCLKAELLVELYVLLEDADTKGSEVIAAITSFMHDNTDFENAQRMESRYNLDCDFNRSILMDSDLSTPDYMYRYGWNIGENELGIYEFLSKMPESELQAMADTYTEGFRIGFITCNKDIKLKDYCEMIFPIGFEPMMRLAALNFEKMGLDVVVSVYSTKVNKQYSFDHEKDLALYLNKSYLERNVESFHNLLERFKEKAPKYAGPAVVEVFGETPFEPESRKANLKLDEKQNELFVQMQSQRMQLQNEYIHGDERSFTIIAYPIPEIGDRFTEIFAETVKINTLDYVKYQTMQQKIIDVLDTADHVHVVGSGKNKTDIKVKIYPLADPSKETAFENCVADVNIPVGEVFTSPVLEGTNGKLHVTQVYLNDKNFLNLELDFKDGKIASYTCTNFENEADNKQYLDDNLLFNHPTLPLGEFAIGTNTTAYRMGIEYDIQAKLPILIAEKTGPHFAVGDTCYSYDEDNETFNPDGKKIVARENSVSCLRKEDPSKAYFNCHTDITIPYNELKSITAVAKDGSETPIILDGRFVVPGTEELNIPLEGLL